MARTGDNALVPALGVYGQNSAPTFSGDLTEVADDVAQVLAGEVADLASLPSAGNWVNRMIWVDAENEPRWWNGAAWVGPVNDTGWLSLGYGSGFSSPGFGYSPQYKLEGTRVKQRGTSSKTGNLAATDRPFGQLPVGFRPQDVVYRTVQGAGAAYVNVQIDPTGVITVKSTPTINASWLSIDGFDFDID